MTTEESNVVALHESGMAWPEIADELGVSVDDAMQQYRDEVYDHWDTGWELDAEDGGARFTSGAVEVWGDGDGSVMIEELTDTLPLSIVVEDEDTRTLAAADLNAKQARELAAALDECADILEGKDV